MSDRRWAHVRRLILCFFSFFLSFSFFSKCSNAFRQTSTLYSVWLTFVFLGERYRSRPRLRDEPAFYFTFVSLTRGLLSVPPSSSGMTPRGIFIAMTTLFVSCGTKDLLGSRVGDRWAVSFSWRTRLDPVRSDPYGGYRSNRVYGPGFPFSQARGRRVRSLIVELATNTTRVLQAFFDGIFRDSYCRFWCRRFWSSLHDVVRLSVIQCVVISGRRARPGLPVFPARLSGRMIGSSKCSAARLFAVAPSSSNVISHLAVGDRG